MKMAGKHSDHNFIFWGEKIKKGLELPSLERKLIRKSFKQFNPPSIFGFKKK
jgi:hypothetical protein